MSDELSKLDDKDQGINVAKQRTTTDSFTGWHDVERKDLPYEGIFFPVSYRFQVQSASADTISHYSAMDVNNPLSVQAALTHVIKEHVRIYDGKSRVDVLKVIHESMRFWFAMLVHTYTGNASSLEATEKCPAAGCGHMNKLTITPFVIRFTEASDKLLEKVDAVTGKIVQKTKSYGDLEYQPITLYMRAEMLAFMQEMYQRKDNFDLQFLSYAPLLFPQMQPGQTISDLYKKVYYPLTQDHKKFSVFTKIVRTIALDQLLEIEATCSKCDHRFQVDISATQGLHDIFLAADADDELL